MSPKDGIREAGAAKPPPGPESEVRALVLELSFLNSENLSDSFNPPGAPLAPLPRYVN